MKNEIKIEIAGFCISIEMNDPVTARNVREYYEDFLTSKKAEVKIYVKYGDLPRPVKNIIYKTVNWTLGEIGCKYFILLHDLPKAFRASSIAEFDSRCKSVEFTAQDRTGRHLAMPFMPIFLAILLSKERGAMLHSCGILDGTKGYLFIGPSGSGKSTLANLCGNKTILNDERIIIRKHGRQFRMYGNPWHGEKGKGGPGSAVINKIFLLRLSPQGNLIHPVNRNLACKKIVENCFLPLKGPSELSRTFKFCMELAEKIPCYNLGFTPDNKFWKHFLYYFSPYKSRIKTINRLHWPISTCGSLRIRPYGIEQFIKEDIKGFHQGIDLLVPAMTPVYASYSGRVLVKKRRCEMYVDKSIQIDSSDNLKIIYSHLSEINVKDRQWVSVGQLIGWTADIKTIWLRRPIKSHLHLEIKKDGISVDPFNGYFLRKRDWHFIDNKDMIDKH